MRNIMLIASFSLSLIACQKSSLSLAKNSWHGHYGKDVVKASSKDSAKMQEYDCPTATKWAADTTLYYNHGEPAAVATTWQEAQPHLMQFIGDPIEITPGVWQRLYFIYEYKNI